MNEYKILEMNIEDERTKNFELEKNYIEKIKKFGESVKNVVTRKKNAIIIGSALGLHLMGLATGAYEKFNHFDILTHTLSASALATCMDDFTEEVNLTKYKKHIFPVVMGLGIFWEGLEYITNTPYSLAQGDIGNTLKDLCSDGLGGLVALKGNEITYHMNSLMNMYKTKF